MGEVEIINSNSKVIISVDEKITNKEFLNLLKDKLEKIFVLKESEKKEVVLDIKSRLLNNKEILEMFDILESENKYFIGKINCYKKLKEEITIFKGDIRSGEIKIIDKSLLLIGNINRGAKVVVDGNLYVLGKVSGDVELQNDLNKVYCECIENSLIKIGMYYEIFTCELRDQVVYVNDSRVVNNEYRRGENTNVKSNSSYIW